MPPFSQIKMSARQKKVMVAMPLYDKPEAETVVSLFDLVASSKHQTRLWIQNGSLIHRARSIIADQALASDVDYLLFIDGDMKFPPNALNRLIEHDVDVVGALCTMRQRPYMPPIAKFLRDESGNVTGAANILNYPEDALLEIDSIGMAFTLISRRALQAVKDWDAKPNAGPFRFEMLSNGGELPEDSSFCYRVQQAGLKVHVDTGLSILHKGAAMFGEKDYLRYKDALIKNNGVPEASQPPTA